MTGDSIQYGDISVLLIEDDSLARKVITFYLESFGCEVFHRNFTDRFSIKELQNHQMVMISVAPDRAGIRLLMKIQKKMIERSVKRTAKYIAYTACGRAMAGECSNCGFDEVLEIPASLEDYEKLLARLFSEVRTK